MRVLLIVAILCFALAIFFGREWLIAERVVKAANEALEGTPVNVFACVVATEKARKTVAFGALAIAAFVLYICFR